MVTVPISPPISPIAITMGDPAGIGLDIALAAFASPARAALPRFVFYADMPALRARACRLGIVVQCAAVQLISETASMSPDVLAVVETPCAAPVTAGSPNARNAAAIIGAIEAATAAVAAGAASAIVTNPIAKATLTAAGFKHPGHTEFLGELAAQHFPGRSYHPVMMLASDDLRVVPLTVHVPLARVPSLVTPDLIEQTARITAADLTRRFGIVRPRIWVAGLNPHAGESGTLGREEIEIIAPTIARLKAEGLDIAGPFSADTMFHAAARARYDAVIAMYHDQALIPLKTLAFDDGVNVTLGLPFVRTSPDHGTAFDIAGTGKANPASFIAALKMAAAMAARGTAAMGTTA